MRLRRHALGMMAGAVLLATAPARAEPVSFDLPVQPLADALRAVGVKTGRNILFVPDSVEGQSAPALRGRFGAGTALEALLAGSSLEAVPDGAGGFVVRRAAALPTPESHAQLKQTPQPVPQPMPQPMEEIVVSSSRIALAGYRHPTPVTTLTAEQLDRDAYFDIGDSVRALPQVGASSSPYNALRGGVISGASAGISMINLRNLGAPRTLVLFDGQRVVHSNITGGVDLGTLPTSLIQRIDIVTGGASAAWGSDAVGGVVNLILDRSFTGFKASLEGADSGLGDHRAFRAEASWGADLDGGRGHVILSAALVDSPDAIFQGERGWYRGTYLMDNPVPGGPRLVHADNVGLSQATPGGVITASPANPALGTPANALRGIQFKGPDGTPTPFDFGQVSGAFSHGGDATRETGQSLTNMLSLPWRSVTLFAHGRYRLTDTLNATAQLNYGRTKIGSNGSAAAFLGNLVIRDDNAFLNSGLRDRMAALGISSFSMGTTSTNNLDLRNMSLAAAAASLGSPVNMNYRQLMRGVLSLDGRFGPDWSWSSYYQHGTVKVALRVISNTLTRNYLNAVDAVRVTPGNAGSSGLPPGAIACRSTLTNPANGCQPLNVFGEGVASAAAIAYVTPGTDFENITLNEDVLAFQTTGQLPWSLPAGPVAVALGGEYRKESARTLADPRGARMEWASGNFTDFAGHYSIWEGFAEAGIPLLRDRPFLQALDFNAAGRLTHYSNSGLVQTWKLGLVAQLDDSLRLRATLSRDIRAPNLSELFDNQQLNIGSAIDPRTGLPVQIYTNRQGNPNLTPEKADTFAAGIVVTPSWPQNLTLSADWYAIDIKDAITTIGASQMVAQCGAGITAFCNHLVFNGKSYPGALGQVNVIPMNASVITVSGLDVQADYRLLLGDGLLNWNLTANYTDQETQTLLGTTFDYAGSLGQDSLVAGFPKFRGVASATYANGPWQATLQTRIIGTARLNNAWRAGVDVDDNTVPAIAYLDLRLSWRWSDNILLYGAVDNLADIAPPVIAPSYAVNNAYQNVTTRPELYDTIGRAFRIGIRFTP